MKARIDLNADVGEGFDDEALAPFLSSINVACGGHAGDEESVGRTVALAKSFGLALGAHPSYPDREHFGRRNLELPPAELEDALVEQVLALKRVAEARRVRLVHVKPHGALYNRAARDPAVARVVFAAVKRVDPALRLVCLAGSPMIAAARAAGLTPIREAFADRRYLDDGSLAPRSLPGSVLDDPGAAAAQALAIVRSGRVVSIGGSPVNVDADTLCIHGDSPRAAEIAEEVARRLREAGVGIEAPA
jgi:UPF0271 protein